MPEILTGALGKKMRAECSPTRVKMANIASWSSGVLASLSHWRSRVRFPSKLPKVDSQYLVAENLGVEEETIESLYLATVFWT